jgi:hypothetical protein
MAGLRRVDRDAGQDQTLWLVLREKQISVGT